MDAVIRSNLYITKDKDASAWPFKQHSPIKNAHLMLY